jgi:cellulose synthase/poly-beta-1,6-N-acetylglucosamine synthase-like glycosyltransferase
MDAQHLILWAVVLANLLCFPFFAYLLLVAFAALITKADRAANTDSRLRFQIVIPAHNEEAGIAATVRSAFGLDYPPELFEVLVIADNCHDRTAEVARQEGATVMERTHDIDRSKGHALEYWFQQLSSSGRMDSLDAVVVMDADSVADPQLLRVFARHLAAGRDWIQAFDCVANPGDSWRTRLMAYSFSLINGVLLHGQTALGLSGSFRGNGMCMSIRGLRRLPWNKHGLVEDLEYSWSLRVQGETIAFAPDAVVRAQMLARGGLAAVNQRCRWEFGRNDVRRQVLVPLLRSHHLGSVRKLAAVIELCMPTLVALTLLFLVTTLLSLKLYFDPSSDSHRDLCRLLIGFNSLALLALLLYGLAPFFLYSLRFNILIGLTHFPLYILWKASMLWQRRPGHWIRTTRQSRSNETDLSDPSTMVQAKRNSSEASVMR